MNVGLNKFIKIAALLLICFCINAQHYQTSFVELKFNRSTPMNALNTPFSVENATGYININIPLGGKIGANGLEFVPAIKGINTYRKRCGEVYMGTDRDSLLIQSRTASTMTFNFLGTLGYEGICLPNGNNFRLGSEASLLASGISDTTVNNLLRVFGYLDAEITPINKDDVLNTRLGVGPSGEVLASIIDKDGMVSICQDFKGIPTQPVSPHYLLIPRKKIVFTQEIAYEFTYHHHQYHYYNPMTEVGRTISGPLSYLDSRLGLSNDKRADMFQSIGFLPTDADIGYGAYPPYYRLTAMVNRRGDRIEFTYLDVAGLLDSMAVSWVPLGGTKVVQMQVSGLRGDTATITRPGGERYLVKLNDGPCLFNVQSGQEATFWGEGRDFSVGADGNGPTGQPRWVWEGAIDRIDVENKDLWIKFDYDSQWKIVGASSPGTSWDFHWEDYEVQPNDHCDGLASHFKTIYGVPTIVSGVKELVVTDAASQIKHTTTWEREFPEIAASQGSTCTPNPDGTWTITPSWVQWKSTTFRVAEARPDHTVIVTYYVPPPEGPDLNPYMNLTVDRQMQLIAFLKHLPYAVATYAPGTNWRTSNPYKVHAEDRWTVRSATCTGEKVLVDTAPYPNRRRDWDGLTETLTSATTSDWDVDNRGWKTTQENHEVYQDPSALLAFSIAEALGSNAVSEPLSGLFSRRVQRTLKSWPEKWAWATRSQEQESILDKTGSLSVKSDQVISLPVRAYTFDPDAWLETNSLLKGLSIDKTPLASGAGKGLVGSVEVSGKAGQIGSAGASYGYDEYGLLTKITPKGAAFSIQETHDESLRPKYQIDADDRQTHILWDEAGRLSKIEPPGEESTTLAYTDNREVQVDRGAQSSKYRYNGFGNLIWESRKGPTGWSSRRFGYDAAGRKTWESGWLSVNAPEENGRWGDALGPDDVFMPAVPDQMVNTDECLEWTTITDTSGYTQQVCVRYATATIPGSPAQTIYKNSTHFLYDSYGRPTRTIDPNGSVTQIAYGSSAGTTTRSVTTGLIWDATAGVISSPAVATTTFTYDVLGRLTSVLSPGVGSPVEVYPATQYKYDEESRIAQVIQSDNYGHSQYRTWTYDATTGYLTELIQPESGSTTYGGFTIHGKPTVTNYAGRKVFSRFHPNLDRIERLWDDDGLVEQEYTYDDPGVYGAKGRLWKVAFLGGSKTYQYFQSTGRLAEINHFIDNLGPFKNSLHYDGYGNLDSRTYPNSGVQDFTHEDMTGLTSGSTFSGGFKIDFGFEANTWNLGQMSWSNGASTRLTYDKDQSRLLSMTHDVPVSSGFTRSWNYTYDAAGHLSTDGEDWYVHDKLGRLIRASVFDPAGSSGREGVRQEFDYDAFGNRTRIDSKKMEGWIRGNFPTDSLVTTLSTKAASYSFNRSDLALTGSNHLPATTSSGAATGVVYDAQGNIHQINTSIGSNAPALSLAYDALGRVKTMSDLSKNLTEVYYYDDEGLRIMTETYQGSCSPQNLQKKQYRIYNENRQLISEYELVLE